MILLGLSKALVAAATVSVDWGEKIEAGHPSESTHLVDPVMNRE